MRSVPSRLPPFLRVHPFLQKPKMDYGISSTRHHINPRPRTAKVPQKSRTPKNQRPHNNQNNKQNPQNPQTHFRELHKKTPNSPPIPNPKNPEKNPCQHTPHYLYYLSHQPNYQRKPYRKSTDTDTRDSRFRIKSAWFTPSAGRGLYQPPF